MATIVSRIPRLEVKVMSFCSSDRALFGPLLLQSSPWVTVRRAELSLGCHGCSCDVVSVESELNGTDGLLICMHDAGKRKSGM